MAQAVLRTAAATTASLSAAQRDNCSHSTTSLHLCAKSPALTARLPLSLSKARYTKGNQLGCHTGSSRARSLSLTRCAHALSLSSPSDPAPADASQLPLAQSATLDSPQNTSSESKPSDTAGTPRAEGQRQSWARVLGAVLLAVAVALGAGALLFPQTAAAAAGAVGNTIRSCAVDTSTTSTTGLKITNWLRANLGGLLSDEAIVVLLAALPIVELRGAVPVALWMGMSSTKAFWLSVLGNMIPVPFILLSMGKVRERIAARSRTLRDAMDGVLAYTRRRFAPLEEFHFVSLMLFVGVPLPGTGAWSGAIGSYLLNMPFWDAFWANFFGVLIAGGIMCNLCLGGWNRAISFALNLFLLSGGLWSTIRSVMSVMKATGP